MICLASASPRRRELLKLIVDDFITYSPSVDETFFEEETIEENLMRISKLKAYEGLKQYPDHIIISCDTVVILDNIVFGKPSNRKEAVDMLMKLNGRTHSVKTSCSIITNQNTFTFISSTDVEFGVFGEKEYQEYTEKNDVLDKAGAYAIQSSASKFIKKISGDYYTVMGLPIYQLNQILKKV
jgi:septum formation protein